MTRSSWQKEESKSGQQCYVRFIVKPRTPLSMWPIKLLFFSEILAVKDYALRGETSCNSHHFTNSLQQSSLQLLSVDWFLLECSSSIYATRSRSRLWFRQTSSLLAYRRYLYFFFPVTINGTSLAVCVGCERYRTNFEVSVFKHYVDVHQLTKWLRLFYLHWCVPIVWTALCRCSSVVP